MATWAPTIVIASPLYPLALLPMSSRPEAQWRPSKPPRPVCKRSLIPMRPMRRNFDPKALGVGLSFRCLTGHSLPPSSLPVHDSYQ